MTCPGHATILTGAYPYQFGFPLNEWFDSATGKEVYCASDESSPIVGREAPAKEGMSPKRLVGSTLGDELKIAGYRSKVVSLALKDRSAIMMGGHRADLALWLEDGRWVSSKHYLPEGKLPEWVQSLNRDLEKEKGTTFKWSVRGQATGLTALTSEPVREVLAGSKESFATQYGVRVTTDAAVRVLREMKLGQGEHPDILAVSYSSHDMLGHARGLQALEMEEITMYEDESIGELLKAIDKSVGLKNVVFAFTGDHGVAPAVDVVKAQGLPSGQFESKKLLEELNKGLEKKYGKSRHGDWISKLRSFNFYLNPKILAEKKRSRTEVENELKRLLLLPASNGVPQREGIAQVFTRTEWEEKKLPPGRWERQILKTYIPGLSGDVVMIPKPFWVNRGAFATHSTGYEYDRTVPLILAGPGIKKGVYPGQVEVVDIAPTLSFVLGLVAPSGADGRVLGEIF
jgi:predicted AlkP superfamily pyrophosphatase or phosphodiesterase